MNPLFRNTHKYTEHFVISGAHGPTPYSQGCWVLNPRSGEQVEPALEHRMDS